MVGASMACALQDTDYRIAVVEAFIPSSDDQPSFDERTVALTYSSKLIFNAIGAWSKMRREAFPILNIEVTSQDSLGFTTLGVDDVRTPALGYVVPTRAVGAILHEKLTSQSNLDLICPATVESIQTRDSYCSVCVLGESGPEQLKTKLVIIADGGRSNLLGQLGLKTTHKTYQQCALVSIIGSDRPHGGKAYEHFTRDGPLALLPLRSSDFSLAWTLKKHHAEELKVCSDADFINGLQSTFGKRAGYFTSFGRRNVYPLSLTLLDRTAIKRTVIIGNAAHTVHPVAGQGFNLGLRDVGFLHEFLTAEPCLDPGNSQMLNRYSRARKHDTKRVSQFTDGLIKAFTSELNAVKTARGLGLTALNLMPGIKKSLLRRTMGIHGHQSRLALRGKCQQ